MNNLKDFINESLVNEAKRIDLSSLSDEEFIYYYWSEWSGFATGCPGGTSTNSAKFSKLYSEASRRYGKSAYDITTSKIQLLDDFLCKEFGVGKWDDWCSKYRANDPKVVDFAKSVVKLNIDDLTSDEEWLQLKEFNFKK